MFLKNLSSQILKTTSDVVSITSIGTVPEFIQSHYKTKADFNRDVLVFFYFWFFPLVLAIFTEVGENTGFSPKKPNCSI